MSALALLKRLQTECPGLQVGAAIRRPGLFGDVDAIEPDQSLSIASVGKLLLLIEVARQLAEGALDPTETLEKTSVDPVADSGLWQHLDADRLSVLDVARLIAAVSDNLATNVLLKRVGRSSVDQTRISLGLEATVLCDRIRDHRGPSHPATFATGSASELCELMARLHAGVVVSEPVSGTVLDWMANNADLSMVASGFDLDPLAHAPLSGQRFDIYNKTGNDATVRAEAGIVENGDSAVYYSIVANWRRSRPPSLSAVHDAMRAVGRGLVSMLLEAPPVELGPPASR